MQICPLFCHAARSYTEKELHRWLVLQSCAQRPGHMLHKVMYGFFLNESALGWSARMCAVSVCAVGCKVFIRPQLEMPHSSSVGNLL